MGQKVKPIGLRVGINRTWDSRWYAGRNYGELLHQDIQLRTYLMDRLKQAAISRVVIERPAGRARVTIHAGRPGLIIGKKGQDIEKLRADLSARIGGEVSLNIVEVRKPEIDAKLVAENIAQQLERRIGFRRAMKRAVQSAMRLGALGVRINCAGRLGGAEIARTEWYREGACHFIRCAPTLIMVKPQLSPPMGLVALKYGCLRVRLWRTTQWLRINGSPNNSLARHRAVTDKTGETSRCYRLSVQSSEKLTKAVSTEWPKVGHS